MQTKKPAGRTRIRMREVEQVNLISIHRHTSAKNMNLAFRYALQFFCSAWQAAFVGRKILLVHTKREIRLTLNFGVPSKGSAGKIIYARRPRRRPGQYKEFEARLEPDEVAALRILMDRKIAVSRSDALRQALSAYALVAERYAQGFIPVSTKGEDVLPLQVPGLTLLRV